MSSRVTGAGLALIAVALLAVSLATPVVLPAQLSLFAGHPTVAGRTRQVQDVYVGLYSAELCNSGGDGTCKSGDATGGFRALGFAELGLTGVLALGAGTLALLTLRRSERRKGAARLIWVMGALAIACGAGLVLVGPFHGASAPVGIGMALHAAGILAAMIGGAIAIRPPPPIRLRVADRGAPSPTALPTAQAFNRRAVRNDGPPRLADPGFDPRPGEPMRPPSPPGPFAAAPGHPGAEDGRLFSPPPQLRPLYDANPVHGGTGGLLPIERPAMPSGPPTPASRAMPPAMAGISLAADEPTAAAPPFPPGPPGPPGLIDEPRPALPFADGPRPALPFSGDASRPMPPLFPSGDARPGSPPYGADEPRPAAPAFTADALRPTMPRAAADDPRPMPPPPPPPSPPGARAKPMTAPPPLPASVLAAAQAAPPAPPPYKPRTQVSLVPPMPDNDLPIAPPTAQIVPDLDGRPESAAPSSHTEPTSFPRAETPLAPPPLPIAPPPPVKRDSALPRPLRDTQSPRPPALRAAVPMPMRTGRSAPNPTRPPPLAPPPAPARGAPPRPTISTSVPPIPAIPAIPAIPVIPAIPPARRADTDVTDPDGRAAAAPDAAPDPAPDPAPDSAPDPAGDGDGATISRVPIEVGDYVSQTNVSVGMPSPEEIDAAVEAAGRNGADAGLAGHVPDTSPSGEPVAAHSAEAPASAAAIASRPTIQAAAQRAADQPTIIAAPISPIAAPIAAPAAPPPAQVRDRPMPRLPISTAPDSLPPPKDSKQTIGPSPACPQCEAPMAWVEEHLRFYCKSCRMYF